MRDIYIVVSPSGYWEGIFQSFDEAQEFLEEHFPPLSMMGYHIAEWVASPKADKEAD